MQKVIVILTFLVFVIGCSTTQNVITKYVSFDQKQYSQTNEKNIQIYKTRLDLRDKFYEIGVIKVGDSYRIAEVIKLAAQNGADALLEDDQNYVLIKYESKM